MRQWETRIAEKNPFVAVIDDEVVGLAELEGNGFIDYFYVHPKWQNQGIGKALLSRLEFEASQLGVSKLFADVSITAEPFFSSRGFHVTESRLNIILGHPAPNFAMTKPLNTDRDRTAHH